MDLNFTSEELAFRDEVRAFLQAKLPAEIAAKTKAGQRLTKADQEQWHAILNGQGWLANHWPEQYGGPGWGAVQKFIFDTECALAGGPRIVPFGVNMLGPVLIKYGSEAQKSYWLPRILSGQDWWCQGYSEPGAGSDLASVKTTAVRVADPAGDYYLVNGQKTWTTQGQHANMIFCLVRTNKEVKAQSGISFILVDMNTPGVELRPIKTLDGDSEVNEVFFTDVKVPVENLVGEENKGWTYAKYLLTYERTGIAGVGFCIAALAKLKVIAAKVSKNGQPLDRDPLFAARIAQVEIELENMKTTNLRVIAAVAGGGVPGAESSMLKIKGTEIRQEIHSLIRRAMGPYAAPFIEEAQYGPVEEPVGLPEAATAATNYFNYRKLSIFGGSNEIQKNIISKMILGL
ncbi:pimeloyl-CoA dehydrogenase large subunit [Lampropedia aestuarii]|uniref:Pimeloyl-CoA dehydrogenase large subunit n=1 Tax=Lampropedia aestuarii TaxID=2562762 RepID=A0A4S5BSC4_9BURK|nr:acyl-CoA dehydrogenase family protein [Lampropedia aestuarii]THJ35717.1 pimeloyl-CoA dehydrogenase large subunit [Lampropedia aestuarii]